MCCYNDNVPVYAVTVNLEEAPVWMLPRERAGPPRLVQVRSPYPPRGDKKNDSVCVCVCVMVAEGDETGA